ncbi:MAG: O-antigen ligase family protein [Bacteroidales bacterium]|nr:O-antigen ligase family protein [Bacteroidales bacterium]
MQKRLKITAHSNNQVSNAYSILLALSAGVWTLTTLLLIASPSLHGIMTYLYIAVATAWVLVTFFSAGKGLKMSAPAFVMMVVCLIAYLFTVMYSQYKTSATFVVFFCEVILSFLMVQVKINARAFLLTSMLMPLIGLPFIDTLFLYVSQEDSLGMGTSYAFMLPAVCTIVYLLKYIRYDRRLQKMFMWLLVAVNMLFMYLILSSGSRGVVLSLIFTIVAIYIFPFDNERDGIRMKSWRSLLILLGAILIGIYFWNILDFFNTILKTVGITIYGLDRTVEFHKAGDVLTGRDNIVEIAWDAFLHEPLFGHGVSTFPDYTNDTYPWIHNSVIQLLFDGGLVLFLLVVYPLFRSIKYWFRTCTFDDYLMVLVLFSASVPGSLFSHDLWSLPILWMFVGFSLKYCKSKHA